jgi:hypothetical protein
MAQRRLPRLLVLAAAASLACLPACYRLERIVYPPPPAILGTPVDELMKTQEDNAELAKFVIYMHEFELNGTGHDGRVLGYRLTPYGQDHVRRIAENLKTGQGVPAFGPQVIVERSETSAQPGTEFGYPIHFNDQLDQQRRQVVVQVLTALGVPDAEPRVVVAPSFSHGLTSDEAARAYGASNQGQGFGAGLGGVSPGGFGGFGGFGGY